ncbi:hypothetical protein Q3G72_024086 [Acer saccharum]|nr:hypothetical protein Q3G72_024086 [Acer saccharum]
MPGESSHHMVRQGASSSRTNHSSSTTTDHNNHHLKLSFPKFGGEDPTGWIFKAEHPTDYDDPFKALSRLKQVSTVATYQEEFEKLSHQVDGLPEGFLIGCFIAAHAVSPKTTNTSPASLLGPYPSQNSNTAANPIPSFRQITGQEARERRAKGLCFYCDEKFVPGHRCQCPQLFMIEDTPLPSPLLDDDVDEDTLLDELLPESLFHAIASTAHPQTLRVLGKLRNKEITVLIDSGMAACQAVLGVQWLVTLGPIKTDYSKLSMTFHQAGKAHTFQEQPPVGNYPEDINQILTEFDHIFVTPSHLPPFRQHDHQIPLAPNQAPVSVRPYRYPHYQKSKIKKMVKEMLDSSIIHPSCSPFSSPVLLVKKADRGWRFYVDYRALNNITIKDKYSILVIDELLDKLHGAKYFSKLDIRSGYHQICVQEADIHKTAFRTHNGHYEFLIMPFSLTNAPSSFQSLMNDVSYLGHHISKVGVVVDPEKIRSVLEWPIPTSTKGVRGFLGLVKYYQKFIRGFGGIAAPLTQTLKKDGFVWPPAAAEAFSQLKQALTSPPALYLPDFSQPFVVECDACGIGI